MARLVTIGGGSGQYALLSGLRDIDDFRVSAVVSMADSGGSTGRLRDEYGVLPPGDVLKCLVALSPHRESARSILQKRFGNGKLNGHNAGNMLLTILSQYAGSFPEGVEAMGEVLEARGRVLPVTVHKTTLVAELSDGSRLYGEAAIDVPRGGQREKITKVFLVPHHSDSVKVYPPVIEAILNSDMIVIGPGDLYTSIIPNFLVPGVSEAVRGSRAKCAYVVNIMTKFGETDGFSSNDFVSKVEEYVGKRVDVVIINTRPPSKRITRKYKKEKAYPVNDDLADGDGRLIVRGNFMDSSGSIVRHDSHNLAESIMGLYSDGDIGRS